MSEACRSGPKHYGRVSDTCETKMENEATPEVERAIESTVEHKKSAIGQLPTANPFGKKIITLYYYNWLRVV